MVAVSNSFASNRDQMAAFNDKYQVVLSSCRLLTEAQSALDRSIKDFVAFAEVIDPSLVVNYTSPVSSPASAPSALKSANGSANTLTSRDAATGISSGDVPSKKEKKTRDPDMPKRPASAFFLFQNAIRNSVKAAMPDEAKGVDIQKAVSDKWKDLDEAGRKPYNDQHERETHEYETKIAAYNQEKGIQVRPKAAARNAVSKATEKQSDAEPQGSDDDAAAASLVQEPVSNTPNASSTPKSNKKRRKSDHEGAKKDKTPKKVDKVSEEKKKKRKKTETGTN